MIRSDIRKPPTPAAPLAEDGSADFGAFVHLGLWGGFAAACLLVVAFAASTETGQSRLATAYSSLTGAALAEDRQGAERNRLIEEARRTAETIRNLTRDRDQLLARMTALERKYEDVTGSIGKLANTAKPPVEPVPAPSSAAPELVAPTPAASTPAPAAPVAATAPAAPEPQEPVSGKAAFGVDIGGGPTLAALRTAWERVRRNHASLLDGLQPVIAVRESRSGQTELRLVAGPIGNAAAAARLCASLAAAGLSCQPTAYDGQRLALR